MTSFLRPLLIKSRSKSLQCFVRTVKTLDEKYVIKGPPRNFLKWTDEKKFPYELVNPYKDPEPEIKPRDYEESTAEWHFVEKLLPTLCVPEPKAEEVTPSGWQPPADKLPNLTYYVQRTRNYMFPVYLEIRNGGTRKMTLLKHIQGDIWNLEKDLKTYLQVKYAKIIPTQVHEPCGLVRFKGDFCDDVKEWLGNTGF